MVELLEDGMYCGTGFVLGVLILQTGTENILI